MSKKKNIGNPKQVSIRAGGNATPYQWAYLFLFTLAILLYANTINHKFAFDDSVVITGNKYTKEGFAGIKTLATKDLFYGIYGKGLDLEGGRWRPLTLVLFAVEYSLFGDNAMPFHIINILLYGITAIIVFKTLMEIFGASSLPKNKIALGSTNKGVILAFLTSVLFIAHPIHTEVVCNIKSGDEILSFLFLCLMLYYLFRYTKTSNKRCMLFSVLFYFTALLSKENGITFLAVIPLTLFCFSNKNIQQSMLLTVPFLITAGVYLAIRTSFVGMIGDRVSNDITDNPFLTFHFPNLPVPIPFMDKLATVSWILLKYLLLLIFPHPLTSDYGFNEIPAIGLSSPKAIASVLIYGGLLVFAGKVLLDKIKQSRKKEKEDIQKQDKYDWKLITAFSVFYYVITISIVSNLFFLIGTTMGERFAYLSSLGFCLALAAILIKIFKWESFPMQQPSGHIYKLYPVFLLLLPYSYKIITRNQDWKDNKTLFTADVKTSSHSANAHYYYANTLFTDHINDEQSPTRDSIFVEAKKEFRKSISINPYFHYCYYNIGLIWEKMGQPDSAIVYQLKTIHLKPDNSMAQYMAKGALGLVYGKLKGDYIHAIPLLKEALTNKPDDNGYLENLGICYAMKGDYDNSIKEFETSLRLKKKLTKEDARLFMNMGISWQNKGNKQKAEECFRKAFQLDPSLKK